MPKLPTVAIIGRPNTGKSTLFNRLVGRRKSIISETPGTTRDQVAQTVTLEPFEILLVDTGGMGGGTADKDLEEDVHLQSLLALEHADVIIVTFNSREELTSNDFEILTLLRTRKKQHVPVITVLTKCDDTELIAELVPQFYEHIHNGEIIPISAPHKIGIDALQSAIVKHLEALNFVPTNEQVVSSAPRIAIIGRPNVGKSSIVNALMNEKQRSTSPILVSDIPGTTRDSIDTTIMHNDKEYLFVDTAGIKRRKDTPEGIETHAYFRSIRSLEHCDIAVLVVDALADVSKQDKRIANLAIEEGKGLIILMNKWDALEDSDAKKVARAKIEADLSFCSFARFIPCSATTKEGLLHLFDAIAQVNENRHRRLTTKDINTFFHDNVHGKPVGQLQTCKYITQVDEIPPTFVLFVRNPKQVQQSQLRFLENRMREVFSFEGTPIRWYTRGNKKAE